jgi:phosphate transport system protein
MAIAEHITKAFDLDLQELARAIAEMGGLAEWQIAMAIRALTTKRAPSSSRTAARRGLPELLHATSM